MPTRSTTASATRSSKRPSPSSERSTPTDAAAEHDQDLLERLTSLGVEEDEARASIERGDVPLVLLRRVLGDDRPYTFSEMAARAGVDEQVLLRVYRSTGYVVLDNYGEREVVEARGLGHLIDVFGEDSVVRSGRVRHMAARRVAMVDLDVVRERLIDPLRASGADDVTMAAALGEAAAGLLDVVDQLAVSEYRYAIMRVLDSELASMALREGVLEMEMAVGFVDLVGYTELSAAVDPGGLADVLQAFEERVFGVVAEAEPVATVKFVGDAAMLTAPDPVALADALLTLVEPVEALADAPLRAGMCAGPVLARDGDFYGAPVNTAARLTDQARPWTLLADESSHDVLAERFELHRIRPVRLRGIGTRRPLAVRRADV